MCVCMCNVCNIHCNYLAMTLQKMFLFDDNEEDSAADDDDSELRIRHEFSGPKGSKVN